MVYLQIELKCIYKDATFNTNNKRNLDLMSQINDSPQVNSSIKLDEKQVETIIA